MTARIGRGQHEIAVQLFGGVHFHHHRLAMIGQHATAIVIEHELGINQVAMILDQPIHSIRCAAFLIRRQRRIMSRLGTYPSFFIRISVADMIASPSFISLVPRP